MSKANVRSLGTAIIIVMVLFFPIFLTSDFSPHPQHTNLGANLAEAKISSCNCEVWGDVNGDGGINPLDVSFMVNYVFKGLDARVLRPDCPMETGNVNCDAGVNPLDVVYFVNYVFKNRTPWDCYNPCWKVETEIPPEGGTVALQGVASMTFPPGAFESPNLVKLEVIHSVESDEAYDFAMTIRDAGPSLPYDFVFNTGSAVVMTDSVFLSLQIPASFVSSLPPEYRVAILLRLYQDGGEEVLDNFEFVQCHYDSITGELYAWLPWYGFTDQRNADTSFEVVIKCGSIPYEYVDALRRKQLDLPADCPFVLHSPFGSVSVGKSSGFSCYRCIPGQECKPHLGVDFPVPIGTPVYPMADGQVEAIKNTDNGSGGRYVMIRHTGGYVTTYLHLSAINVEVGKQINIGEILGLSGNSGHSTGPHLHVGLTYPSIIGILGNMCECGICGYQDPEPCFAKGEILATPDQFHFEYVQCGLDPEPQVFYITNIGEAPMDWDITTSSEGNWLTGSPTTGHCEVDEEASLLVAVTRSDLDPGTYYGEIIISSPDARNSPQHLWVEYEVTPAPIVLEVEATVGGIPLEILFDGKVPGGGSVELRAVVDPQCTEVSLNGFEAELVVDGISQGVYPFTYEYHDFRGKFVYMTSLTISPYIPNVADGSVFNAATYMQWYGQNLSDSREWAIEYNVWGTRPGIEYSITISSQASGSFIEKIYGSSRESQGALSYIGTLHDGNGPSSALLEYFSSAAIDKDSMGTVVCSDEISHSWDLGDCAYLWQNRVYVDNCGPEEWIYGDCGIAIYGPNGFPVPEINQIDPPYIEISGCDTLIEYGETHIDCWSSRVEILGFVRIGPDDYPILQRSNWEHQDDDTAYERRISDSSNDSYLTPIDSVYSPGAP